jgi:hypothetical protein
MWLFSKILAWLDWCGYENEIRFIEKETGQSRTEIENKLRGI